MATETLVEPLIDDGRKLIERLIADGFPLRGALWIRRAEEDFWFLYLLSESYDKLGPSAAYRAVHASHQKLTNPWITLSEIKVVSPQQQPAASCAEAVHRYPAIPEAGLRLRDREGDEAYVYPPELFAVASKH